MCKYCNGSRQLGVFSDADLRAEIDTDYGNPHISMWVTIDAGYFGYEDVEGSFEIEYCPMCGRKLMEDDEDDPIS